MSRFNQIKWKKVYLCDATNQTKYLNDCIEHFRIYCFPASFKLNLLFYRNSAQNRALQFSISILILMAHIQIEIFYKLTYDIETERDKKQTINSITDQKKHANKITEYETSYELTFNWHKWSCLIKRWARKSNIQLWA